jgi:hypothetical protein
LFDGFDVAPDALADLIFLIGTLFVGKQGFVPRSTSHPNGRSVAWRR